MDFEERLSVMSDLAPEEVKMRPGNIAKKILRCCSRLYHGFRTRSAPAEGIYLHFILVLDKRLSEAKTE
jgi:hypothetical protein